MSESNEIRIGNLPKTALQAIYHAVTGKTENITKSIKGNVEIRSDDIDHLYDLLQDQRGIHDCVVEPTITVVIKDDRSRSITHSSWEKYKTLGISSNEITSEVSLRFEFLLQLPGTPQPQRCTVDINLDSSLPVISSREDFDDDFGFMIVYMGQWRTVKVSIDFVDFLVAKSFLSVVEEWFKKLPSTPEPRLNSFLVKRFGLLRAVSYQTPRLGAAAFILAFILFVSGDDMTARHFLFGSSLLLVLWCGVSVFSAWVLKEMSRRLRRNIVPSVILLNRSDAIAYGKVTKDINSVRMTVGGLMGSIVISILINLISGFLLIHFS